MELRDAKQSGDTGLYENTILATRYVASAAPQDTEEIKKEEEEHYESLRLSSDLNKRKVVRVESTRKCIQWEDISNRMKYTVYIFSSILIAVNIGVIVVAVIIALPTTKVNGNWAQWLTWSNCDVTCDNGTQTRMRFCINPAPTNGGNDCIGNSTDTRFCQNDACAVNGNWGQWLTWSNCDVTCDNGTQTRMRFCINPAPTNGGNDCIGNSTDTRFCQSDACVVNGNWAQWLTWSNCDVTCDNGTQTRMRFCINPAPTNGGNDCIGNSTDTRLCQIDACVGDWNQWSPWGSCSVSCDIGMQRRDRSCPSPHQSSNGYNCVGESREDRLCMLVACADGGWSSWGSWGSCSGTCGGGVRLRSRSCTNPSPSLIGRPCTGDSSDVSFCNRQLCPDYNVTFTAYNLNTSETSYTDLQFLNVHLNNGDAYSTTTGKFTCKIPGVYYFAVTLTKQFKDIDYLYVNLRINDSNKLRMRFYPDDDNSNELVALPLTTSGTFHLNTNDAVYVYGIPSYFSYSIYSTFTGILLIPDQ